jgi:hypothetical protein
MRGQDAPRRDQAMRARRRLRLPRSLRRSRPLAALALSLALPLTAAAAPGPAGPLGNLQRDLGALQALLEQVDPGVDDGPARPVEFNAELGDGSPAFRRDSMVTMVHAAGRNLDQLIGAYHATGDERRAGDAETLRLSLYGLTERIERLARPAGPATVVALRDQSRTLLDEMIQDLDLLPVEPAAPGAAPAPQP